MQELENVKIDKNHGPPCQLSIVGIDEFGILERLINPSYKPIYHDKH
jgi:hypothetical protein